VVDNTHNSKKSTSRLDVESQANPEETGSVGIDKQIEKLEVRRSVKELQRAAGNLMGQRVRDVTEKLLTRTLSGVVYAAIVLAALFVGKKATIVLIAGMAWLCCSEFYTMSRLSGRGPNEVFGLGVKKNAVYRLEGKALVIQIDDTAVRILPNDSPPSCAFSGFIKSQRCSRTIVV